MERLPGAGPPAMPMLNMSPGSGPASLPKGRAKACTACRQVKLRCDARELAPDPCSRCRASGLECKMDPTFKRVPARKQLEEVSNRLNSLQRSLGLEQNPHLPATGASLEDYIRHSRRPDDIKHPFVSSRISDLTQGSSDGGSPPPWSSDGSGRGSTDPPRFLALEDEHETGTWQLGDVILDADSLRILFAHFDATHWRHVPFLEPCTSLHAYYQSSELLFWTVVLASCFLFNDFHTIHGRLLPFHRQLLTTRMLGERVSLRTIHAMLLMCTWTYPVSHQYDDLTWILCGTAVNMAMVMGLHRPGHTHEYAKDNQTHPGSVYTRNCTWLACFVISAGISAWLGMPPPLSATSHIDTITSLCRDKTIPRRYRARADIQKRAVQLSTALDAPRLDFRTRHALIQMYEQELDYVQALYEDVWTDDLEIEYMGVKLYLFGIAFVSHGPAATIETEAPALAAREVLQRGLAAAVGILDVISHMRLPQTAPGENRSDAPDYIYQLGFYPKYFFRIGGFANFFLLWFLAVDAQASAADRELARTYITFTYRLMISIKGSAEHVRAGKAIEELARMSIHSGKPSALRVNSRLGASFMYSYTLDGAAATANPKFQILPTLGAVGEDASSPDGHESGPGAIGVPMPIPSGPSGLSNGSDSSTPPPMSGGRGLSISGASGVGMPNSAGLQGPPSALGHPGLSYPGMTAGVAGLDLSGKSAGMHPSLVNMPSDAATQAAAAAAAMASRGGGGGGSSGGGAGEGAGAGYPPGVYDGNNNMNTWAFPWAEWDPAVLDGLRMDVDAEALASAGLTGSNGGDL